MVAAPVLLLFIIAMLDFARGIRAAQEGERAARYEAWHDARRREDPSSASSVGTQAHYRLRGSQAGRRLQQGSISAWAGPKSIGYRLLQQFEQLPGMRGVTRGGISFLAGTVDYVEAETAFRPAGIRLFTGGTVRSRHAVSIDAHRERNPSDPEGWWDPFHSKGGLLSRIPQWIRQAWPKAGS
jgi:hypothetical protein